MARARLLKPGFFTDDDLGQLTPLTRLLFAGLWCIADRAGRLEDRPRRIKAEVLPFDRVNVDALLDKLAGISARQGRDGGGTGEGLVRDGGGTAFIVRYRSGERNYIQITNFTRHQSPHVREPESIIPAPDEHQTSIGPALGQHQSGPAVAVAVAVAETVAVDTTAATAGAREENPEEASPFSETLLALLIKAHENTLGLVNGPTKLAILEDWAARIPDNEIGEASIHYGFRQAALRPKPSLAYIESIFKRLEAEGWPRDMEAGHGRPGKTRTGRNGRSAAEIEADPANVEGLKRFLGRA